MNLEQIDTPEISEILNILSIDELKKHQRTFSSAEDQVFSTAIQSAYNYLSGRFGWLNRTLLTQKWALRLPAFESAIEIPFSPVQSIESITYYDANNDLKTLAPAAYQLSLYDIVPELTPTNSVSWPTTYARQDAVKIIYVAGFGNSAAVKDKAFGVVTAMILLAGHYYQNREASYKEPRMVKVNRVLEFGLEASVGRIRIPLNHS
jgi:uncharacterized phiE125 gp8 family phage protein